MNVNQAHQSWERKPKLNINIVLYTWFLTWFSILLPYLVTFYIIQVRIKAKKSRRRIMLTKIYCFWSDLGFRASCFAETALFHGIFWYISFLLTFQCYKIVSCARLSSSFSIVKEKLIQLMMLDFHLSTQIANSWNEHHQYFIEPYFSASKYTSIIIKNNFIVKGDLLL
jgi:hypothetical protein